METISGLGLLAVLVGVFIWLSRGAQRVSVTTGRNFDEILRALDSIQLTARHQVATPAHWKQGEDVIGTAALSDEEAVTRFGGFDRVLPYLRRTRQPG